MLVTINTDASYHPKHKVGAYAFWIVSNKGKIMNCGPLKEALNPQDCETKCIANALHTLLHSQWDGITRIVINTDSDSSIKSIKRKSKGVNSYCYKLLIQIRKKNGIYGKPIHEFRSIKSHSGTDEKRKWVNDWCDRMAKEQMRKLLK